MTNHETATQPPAHWPEELRAAFWTAVNAPTYDESAAATLALVGQLAGIVAEGEATQWPGPLADLIAPTRPAAVSVPPPATRANDRAAVLHEAADALENDSWSRRDRWGRYEREEHEAGFRNAAELLRRMADEPAAPGPCVAGQQQNETPEARP